jgi:hypothetical protein
MKLLEVYKNGGAMQEFGKLATGTQKTFYRLHMIPLIKDAQEFIEENNKLIEDSKAHPENEKKNGEEIRKMLDREIDQTWKEPMLLSSMPDGLTPFYEDCLMNLGMVKDDITSDNT